MRSIPLLLEITRSEFRRAQLYAKRDSRASFIPWHNYGPRADETDGSTERSRLNIPSASLAVKHSEWQLYNAHQLPAEAFSRSQMMCLNLPLTAPETSYLVQSTIEAWMTTLLYLSSTVVRIETVLSGYD